MEAGQAENVRADLGYRKRVGQHLGQANMLHDSFNQPSTIVTAAEILADQLHFFQSAGPESWCHGTLDLHMLLYALRRYRRPSKGLHQPKDHYICRDWLTAGQANLGQHCLTSP